MFMRTKRLSMQILTTAGGFLVQTGFKANNRSFDTDVKKQYTLAFLFLKSEFERRMKAVRCSQKFICFSFMIKDGKSAIDINLK